jgi:hypothetical protein
MNAEPAPTSDAMLAAIWQLCDAYAKSEVNRVLAGRAANGNEAVRLGDQADYWSQAVNAQYQALALTVRQMLPDGARLEEFLPVRATSGGNVEVHARDTTSRPVVILLTGAQAMTVGTHLTAHGAVALDRVGGKVDVALPGITPAAPLTITYRADPPVVPGASNDQR